MAKRMTLFQRRQLERQQREIEQRERMDRWDKARAHFRLAVELEGIDLNAPFHDLSTASSYNGECVRWFAWWKRDEIRRHTENVLAAVARGPVGSEQLQGGFQRPPGQAETVHMWSDAYQLGPSVFDAAMMLASLRMASQWTHRGPDEPNGALFDDLVEGATERLRHAGLDTSTSSRSRFVPYDFSFREDCADLTSMAIKAGSALGLFLTQYAPVRVAVKHVVPSS